MLGLRSCAEAASAGHRERLRVGRRPADGAVDDGDRIAYLLDHVAAVRRAREAGADVRDYIAWTLLDNFEWAEGYTKKFGLVEIEPETLHRRPKRSYAEYARLIAEHAGPGADGG